MTASDVDQEPVIADCPAMDLDPAALGQMIMWILPAAASARHGRPEDTLRDYVQPTNPTMEFIRDLFTKPTEEIAERWYGGMWNAELLATYSRVMMWGGHRQDG